MALLYMKFLYEPLVESIKLNLEYSSISVADELRRFIDRSYHDIELLSENPIIRSTQTSEEEKLEMLNLVKIHYGIYDDITLIDKNGYVIISTTYNYRGEWFAKEWFNEAKTGKIVMSRVHAISDPYKAITVFLAPVYDEKNQMTSVVAAQLPMSEIWKITDDVKIGKTGFVLILNDVNQIISHPDKNKVLTFFPVDKFEEPPVERGVTSYTENDEKMISAYTYLYESGDAKFNGWKIFVTQPETEALDYVKLTYMNIFIASLITILSSLVLTFIFTRRIITNNINKLLEGSRKIAQGDMNYRVRIKSGDEMEEMAESFNQMISELGGYRKELEKKVKLRTKELNKKVEELTETKTAMLNMMEDLDETNKKLLEVQNELKRNFRELKKLDKEKDEFISIAAHELKTPMTAIHGFSQLLQNEKMIEDVEKRKRYLNILDNETKRLSKLVTDILDLSRIDLGTMRFNLKKTNLYDVLNDMKEEMNPLIKEAGLESEYIIEDNLPDIITDEERLKQILLNLISNAIKYTQKGKVTVKIAKENDFIHFRVIDTGIGIEKKYFKYLFIRFYQISSPYTREIKGAGLGLSICKELVEALGGKIWVESKIGSGSTFHFTLPIK